MNNNTIIYYKIFSKLILCSIHPLLIDIIRSTLMVQIDDNVGTVPPIVIFHFLLLAIPETVYKVIMTKRVWKRNRY